MFTQLEWKAENYGECAYSRNVVFMVIPIAGEHPVTGDARTEYHLCIRFVEGTRHREIASFAGFTSKETAQKYAVYWFGNFCKGVEAFVSAFILE